MFSLFALLFTGAIIGFNAIKDDVKTSNSRSNAKASEKPIYFDSGNAQRSVITNEKVYTKVSKGHLQMVGVKTGRVYEDHFQENLNKKNKVVEERGKNYYYKEFPQWSSANEACVLRVDKKNGLPYKISFHQMSPKKDSYYEMEYYDVTSKHKPYFTDQKTRRILSLEEGEKYIF